MFCKKDVLKHFAKFTEKHLCLSLFFNKVAGLVLLQKETLEQVSSGEFCEISKNTLFYRTHLDDCFWIDKNEKFKYWNWKIEILQSNNSGLVALLKTKAFVLREPQEEIFEFYLRITLTFRWSYYHIGVYFSEINYIFRLPKKVLL